MHYSVLVELPPNTRVTESAHDALDKALEPFFSDCDGGLTMIEWEMDPPPPLRCKHTSHEWDWWELGGRWPDFFQAVRDPSEEPLQGESAEERHGRYRLDHGHATVVEVPKRTGYDLIRKRDIDWEAMAAKATAAAREWYAQGQAALANGDTTAAGWTFDMKQGETEEAYVARKVDTRTHTILTAGGRWLERETFIYVPNGKSYYDKRPDWDRFWDAIVAAMPADAVLAVIDIHN